MLLILEDDCYFVYHLECFWLQRIGKKMQTDFDNKRGLVGSSNYRDWVGLRGQKMRISFPGSKWFWWGCFCCLVAKSHPTLLSPHELLPTRLLCPWYFPGKNTGVDCHFLLQGILLTQGLNMHLLHWQAGSLLLSHQGSPWWGWMDTKWNNRY